MYKVGRSQEVNNYYSVKGHESVAVWLQMSDVSLYSVKFTSTDSD